MKMNICTRCHKPLPALYVKLIAKDKIPLGDKTARLPKRHELCTACRYEFKRFLDGCKLFDPVPTRLFKI